MNKTADVLNWIECEKCREWHHQDWGGSKGVLIPQNRTEIRINTAQNNIRKPQTALKFMTRKILNTPNRLFCETCKSCGHTTDFYLGKSDLPRANSSKLSGGKFISGFVLPTIIVKSVGKVALFTSSFPSSPRPWPNWVDQNVNVCTRNCSVISQHWIGGTGDI